MRTTACPPPVASQLPERGESDADADGDADALADALAGAVVELGEGSPSLLHPATTTTPTNTPAASPTERTAHSNH